MIRTERRDHGLQGKVVVLTGASSGLGRAAALELAGRGCRLALAARRADELERTAWVCRERGAEVLVVPTDVTDADAVTRLAAAVMDCWGEIDVWINNAGVTLFARLADGDLAQHRQVIETNLFGALHGARTVAPIFRRQRRGTLVNVGSLLSEVGNPFVASYVISKFGVHGLSEALRVEFAEFPDIHVSTLCPYAIDTPHFESGANAIGGTACPMPPLQSPEKVARALADLVARPRRIRFVPRVAVLGLALHRLAPRTCERLLLRALQRFHVAGPGPATEGNLFAPPTAGATVHGHRPPRIHTPQFIVWVARELVRMAVQSIRDRMQPWRASNTTSS